MSSAAPELTGKVFIVTGASRGVGAAIAKTLHARGARVALLARATEEVAANAAALGEGALGIGCDVADRAQVFAAVDQVVAAFGGVDGLVNNAGIARIGPIDILSPADLTLMFQVNVLGVLNATQAVIPHLRARGGGNILNISSASVSDPTEFPFLGGYAAVKAALERMTEELRIEVSKDDIAVTTFRLGSTLTYFGTGWDPAITERAFAEWGRARRHGARDDGPGLPGRGGGPLPGKPARRVRRLHRVPPLCPDAQGPGDGRLSAIHHEAQHGGRPAHRRIGHATLTIYPA